MCTTGVLRLSADEYIMFKNKDFGRTHFDDRIVVEPAIFGVEGITTWAGTDPDLDRFSGFSIGANASGLLACDSNVRTVPDHANYDDLVEVALRSGSDVPSGIEAVRTAVGSRPYLWGNLMLIDGEVQAAIEVRGHELAVVRLTGPAARTNHHMRLGIRPGDDDTLTTESRLASAQAYVDAATSVDDIFALLRSHDQGETGICNHALHQTVYSYVLHRHANGITLHVRQGRPCEDIPVFELALPLGARWSPDAEAAFRASYPSARAMAAA